jgi:hypothetical protein
MLFEEPEESDLGMAVLVSSTLGSISTVKSTVIEIAND